MAKIAELNTFNFNFNFSDEHSGLIVLTNENLKEDILLDFYEDNGKQLIDFEIRTYK